MSEQHGHEFSTVLQVLSKARARLRRAGVEDPELNAELLLGKVLGCDRAKLAARSGEPLEPGPRQMVRALVDRRARREPLQYLLGEWEFCGRRFTVTPAVMVPRQETELLVEKCLERIPARGPTWAVDIGTGSGVVAVTLAAERPELRAVATDASQAALEVAALNGRRHGVQERIAFKQGDLCRPVAGGLPAGRKGVEMVASNPPYVPTDRIEALEAEIRDHEPRDALDGGPDGLDVVRRLVPEAAGILLPAGWLVLELGEGQAPAVRALIAATGAFDTDTFETTTDAGGCERVLCVRRRAT